MKPLFTTILGLNLAFYEKPGKSIPIVFVHGLCSNSHAFEQVFENSNLEDFHLFALDLPGHGNSSYSENSADYTILGQSRRVAAFIENLKLDNALVVGHSLGAHVAIHALEFTKRIAGIMIVGASPISGAEDIPKGYNLYEEIMPLFRAVVTEEELDGALLFEVYDQKHQQVIRDSFKLTDSRTREIMGADLGTYFSAPDYVSEIKLLSQPGLEVAFALGEHEKLIKITFLAAQEDLRLWGGKVHLIPDAGHCPPFESPEAFAKVVSDFGRDVGILINP